MGATVSLVYTPHPLRPLHLLYIHALSLYCAAKFRLPGRSFRPHNPSLAQGTAVTQQ